MLTFLSLILIIFLVIILVILRKKIIYKFLKLSIFTKKNILLRNNNIQSNKKVFIKNTSHKKILYQHNTYNKTLLRNQMIELFKGDKKDKLKALKIAGELRDNSTLNILKRGLRDMDPDIVKLSASLIQKFK